MTEAHTARTRSTRFDGYRARAARPYLDFASFFACFFANFSFTVNLGLFWFDRLI